MKNSLPNKKVFHILLRNKYVFRNSDTIVWSRRKRVNLNYWITPHSTVYNFGDGLSSVIVEAMCRSNGIAMGGPVKKTRHLFAIGSILLHYQDATIWGSGFLSDKKGRFYELEKILHKIWHKVDIRAVRGPETRRKLIDLGISCPEVYGDPGLLLPMIYAKEKVEKRYSYLVIPHGAVYEKYKLLDNVCSPYTNDWKAVVDKILQSDFVISSSLHGVIIAEAYGIPTVLLNDVPADDFFKYKDYYYSTGRYELPIANSVQEALDMPRVKPPMDVIAQLQRGLIESFPSDLWLE